MPTEIAERVRSHFYIFLVDETNYWHADIVRRCGGRIRGAYLFDAHRHVYCCEMMPSYEMNPLDSSPEALPEDEAERDAVEDLLREGDGQTNEVRYYHVLDIDLARCIDVSALDEEAWNELLDDADGDREQAYDKALEAVLEHVEGNAYY